MSGNGAVAVIAVHGVGVHTPGDMARDVAALLQGANPDTYSPFACSVLEIPVDRRPTFNAPEMPRAFVSDAPHESRGKKPWYVRSEFVGRKVTGEPQPRGDTAMLRAAPLDATDDIRFTHQAVEGAEIDAKLSIYRTVVFRGERASPGGAARRVVDIYELSWSDLSHLGGFIGRVMSEFYQILFHVATLGQKTVELAWNRAQKDSPEQRRLALVLRTQTITEWLLAGVIPVLSLALLLAVLPLLPIALLQTNEGRAAAIGGLSFAILVSLLVGQVWRSRLTSPSWSAAKICGALAFAAVIGAATGLATLKFLGNRLEIALYLLGTIVDFLIFVWLTRVLIRRRTETEALAPRYAGIAGAAAWWFLLALSFALFESPPQGRLPEVTMRVAEGLFALLALAWSLFLLFALLTCACGAITSSLSKSRRTKAAVWTGKIGIVVPASLFFIVNIFAWHFVARFFIDHASRGDYTSLFEWLMPSKPGAEAPVWAAGLGCPGAVDTSACVNQLLAASTGAGFSAFLALIAASMLLIVAALLPSVVHEIRPTVGETPAKSEQLGQWLDAGIVVSRVAGYVALFALLIVLPGVELWAREMGYTSNTKVLDTLAGLILGSAAMAVTFRRAVLGGVTKAVGIMLDVDNWLKERPLERNPRGRILLRYMALLRHIASRSYGHVVIVSHSQGTAISADLLRYLYAFPDSSIARITDIRLMTFGSPLRQLYGARFPHLYDWARDDPMNPRIPDPQALYRVTHWTNGYRSGDYVGRFLWTATRQWVPSRPPGAPASGEFCLGAGAHTHYFDDTALVVGRAIDQLV